MNQQHIAAIAKEMKLSVEQVSSTAALLDDGATVPFIARYRKEATGSLDENAIVAVRDRLAQLHALDKRRESILNSLQDQEKLTDELKDQILRAETLIVLEDLYLPFRPKRRTRATIAREKGLEPLAELLFAQHPETDPAAEAVSFVDVQRGVNSVEEALSGARDIIAEWVNENAEVRTRLRELFLQQGVVRSKLIAGKESEATQYRDYFDWEEPVQTIPSHRMLAARRGEKEELLTVRILPPQEEAIGILEQTLLKGDSFSGRQVKAALQDSYKRLLAPSLETETKQSAKKRADEEAIRIFADNLRHLLMAAPLGSKKVMAIDPGFRTGCKLVCLDPQGKLLHHDTIYPHSGKQSAAAAAERLSVLSKKYQVEVIAIGNGTAGRETEAFVRTLELAKNVQVIMTDESGASVYSASQAAREEFPNHDVTIRGAISIGRRLMDPLAELVKIDPKSIGVGQYQHDVDQSDLKKSLDDVVVSCVNAVGVEANTASAQLLAYVSGLGMQLAKNIVEYRNENGPFRSRRQFKKVPRLGPKAFEQAGGFLRIRRADNPLDASAVHPESYGSVEAMATDLECSVADLIQDPDMRQKIDLHRYVTPQVGLPTLKDILAELAKPGRDPRETFEPFSFAEGVESIQDLQVGMKLPGIVTNVTAFGAFVDIGVHRDGLVHLSEMADRFVKDPRDVVHVHQHVTVTVLEVDLERKRISLSMKASSRDGVTTKQSDAVPHRDAKKRESKRSAQPNKKGFNNPFAELLKH